MILLPFVWPPTTDLSMESNRYSTCSFCGGVIKVGHRIVRIIGSSRWAHERDRYERAEPGS
jgi:hypothetical protein